MIFTAVASIIRWLRNNAGFSSIKIKENDAFALHTLTIVLMIPPLLFLGRNDGAFLSYFLQLWMPSVTVATLIGIERIDHRGYERIYVCLYALLVISTLFFGFRKLPLHILTDEEIADWEKAYEYTEKYSRSGDVFYARSLAYDGFARGNGEWICDHDGEVSRHTVDCLITAGVPAGCIDHSQQIVAQNLKYQKYITDKAEAHDYALITFETNPKQRLFNEEYCKEIGYICIDELDLRLGNMPYKVQFYVPGL